MFLKAQNLFHPMDHAKNARHSRIDNNPDMLKVKNPWKIAAIILGLIMFVLIYMLYTANALPGTNISGEKAGTIVTDYLNGRTGGGVGYISNSNLGDLYQITVSYQGQNIPVFITKDGKYFVQLALPISGEATTEQPVKSAEPIAVSQDDDAFEGQADAPVTIIEFSDFQCPFCKKFYTDSLPQLREKYIQTGKVKLVFRDFPLSNIHPDAQKAAEAAECAGEQGKYFAMHDKIFENQQELKVADLKKYAASLGLNTQTFNDCLDSGKMKDVVANDFAQGTQYGVSGTPAFYINGKLLSGAQPFSAFEKIIEEELKQ